MTCWAASRAGGCPATTSRNASRRIMQQDGCRRRGDGRGPRHVAEQGDLPHPVGPGIDDPDRPAALADVERPALEHVERVTLIALRR